MLPNPPSLLTQSPTESTLSDIISQAKSVKTSTEIILSGKLTELSS